MRRLNAVIMAVLTVLIVLHGLSGSFLLLELNAVPGKIVGWTAMGFAALHGAISLVLSLRTLRASRSGALYLRQNARFWAVRLSGLALILLLCFHAGAFGHIRSGQFVLFEFTTLRAAVQLLLVLALAVHALAGLGPLLVSLGVSSWRVKHDGLLLFLATLLLFFAVALVAYYAKWQWL